MKLIFMGFAGSGKGTQASLLSDFFHIPSISTGNLLRQKVNEGDELGKNIGEIISSGRMVDDDLIFNILRERLKEKDCENGFILDGFPRDINQAIYLDNFLDEHNDKIDKVIVLSIDKDIVFKRITGRFQCTKCKKIYNKYYFSTKVDGICDDCQATEFTQRADDRNEEAVSNRLDIYEKMSGPIIEYYNKKNLICNVDGLKSIYDINRDILNNLEKI